MRAACWNDGMNSKTVRWKRPCSLGAKRTAFSPSQFEWLASPATSRRSRRRLRSSILAVDGHVPEELTERFLRIGPARPGYPTHSAFTLDLNPAVGWAVRCGRCDGTTGDCGSGGVDSN